MNIGIVCPCPLEYETCCRILELIDETELCGRAVSSHIGGNMEVLAVKAGPGKIQSASATQLIIDIFRPDYIIDVGGAGALSTELKINDIICGKNAFEFDVCDVDQFSHLASDLTTTTVVTRLLSSKSSVMKEFSDWIATHSSTRLLFGDLASGERNISGGKLKEALSEKLGAVACNWETSAVLKTAQLNDIPAFSFRVITDAAGKKMKEEFEKNWQGALEILFVVLKEFIFHGWLPRITRELSSI